MTLFDAQSPEVIWMVGIDWSLESPDWFDVVHLRRLKCYRTSAHLTAVPVSFQNHRLQVSRSGSAFISAPVRIFGQYLPRYFFLRRVRVQFKKAFLIGQ